MKIPEPRYVFDVHASEVTIMRVLVLGITLALASGLAAAQAPPPTSSPNARSKPAGTLAQVMRGIYFPNSNLIFDVQQPAGLAVLEAAHTKNQEKVSDATNELADACSGCHEIYRDKGPADSPARCTSTLSK
jgi:cytochrome c553